MKNWLFVLGFSLLFKTGIAQTGLTNSGILYIKTSSDILHITGTFTNNSGAALTNNGSLYVKGNLTNNQSSMAIGTGILILNGTSTQAINGTQQFKTYNLQTNNSSGITLNNDLSVSYVHFTFPVGNATIERTIALNSLSASSEFNVNYNAPTPNRYNAQAPLLYIDPNEYWNITEVSGGSALVAMNWNNSKVALPPWTDTDIRVASWDGTNWVSAGGTASGNTATTGNITSNSVSSFSRFTFGGEAFPLPLTLMNFNAKHIGNYTTLSWTTADEQNVDHFTAERSDDGHNFYSVVQLAARNTGNREFYSTIDNKPINHIAYYRLLSVDIDGRQKLSRIVLILVSETARNLVLLTNPVHDHLTLVANEQVNGSFNYNVRMASGQLMQQGKLTIQAGGQYELPLKESFQKGVYTLVVNNTLQSFSYRFVVD